MASTMSNGKLVTQAARTRRRLSIRSLLRPHIGALTLGSIAIARESAANLLQPWPLKIVLDEVLRSHESHAWAMRMVHRLVGSDTLAILKFACVAVLAIAVLDAICTFGEKYLTTSVGQWVSYDLRLTLYAHIQKLSLAFHDHKRTGDLISRVTDDIDAIQSFIMNGLLGVLINAMTLVGMIGVMFYLNWKFTLIALSVVPALFAIVYSYTRRIKKASREVRKKEGEITSVVEEVLSSIRVVKAFAREDYEVQRLEQESLEAVDIALRARSLKAKLTPLVGIVVAVGTGLVLWFGARLVMAGALTAGSLVVFILYLAKMYKPMQEISKMADTYSKAAVGYERIQEIVQTHVMVMDGRRARPAPKFKGEIEFDHVSFSYDPGSLVLKNINLQMRAGEVSALVGPTGAGKTSIISLQCQRIHRQASRPLQHCTRRAWHDALRRAAATNRYRPCGDSEHSYSDFGRAHNRSGLGFGETGVRSPGPLDARKDRCCDCSSPLNHSACGRHLRHQEWRDC